MFQFEGGPEQGEREYRNTGFLLTKRLEEYDFSKGIQGRVRVAHPAKERESPAITINRTRLIWYLRPKLHMVLDLFMVLLPSSCLLGVSRWTFPRRFLFTAHRGLPWVGRFTIAGKSSRFLRLLTPFSPTSSATRKTRVMGPS